MPPSVQPELDLFSNSDLAVLISALRDARGKSRALTIRQLQRRLGHSTRRKTEQLLELRLQAIPFCIVADSAGYYRPQSAADINLYLRSLISRIKRLAARHRSVATAAIKDGFPRLGTSFSDPSTAPALPFSKTE